MRGHLGVLVVMFGCTAGTLSGERVGGEHCVDKLVGSDVGSDSRAIVNGSNTSDYPAVGFLTNGSGAFCTGTVIADRLVVTAAHCVEGTSGGFYFGFGASDRSPERQIRVRSVRVHPMWDSFRLLNDIATLELEESAGVTPMPVLFERPSTGWTIKLVGYGVSDGYRQSGGGTKREVDVTIASLESTTWSYRTSGGGSACNGDSGGPAMYRMGSEWVLMGITSWGDQYCVENGYYTRTDLYRDFLDGASEPGGDGGTEPPPMDPPSSSELCTNTCRWPNDGECDDGGPGSLYDECAFGTDCGDCGPRTDPSTPPPMDPPPDEEPKDPPPPPIGEDPPGETPADPPSEDPAPEASRCTNTCAFAGDGECDDGGASAMCRLCALGTDCADCGPR